MEDDLERQANEQIATLSEQIDPMDEVDGYWLRLQRESWSQADDWFETTIRHRMEKNLSHYKNLHAAGSKYNREEYRKRSRLFRPKTRTAIRKMAAKAVRAFFATDDAMSCEPANARDDEDVLAAKIHEEVLNYRLRNSVPWYQITVAALTDCAINGVVVSKQFWDYEEETREISEVIPTAEGVKQVRRTATYVKHDRPMTRLVPFENIRISPSADWLDPFGTTPFIIEQRPYYVADLERRMERSRLIPYRDISREILIRGKEVQYDSVRSKREESHDRFSETFAGHTREYDTVWVRECIINVDGMDWYFETVGDAVLLSDPVPLSRVSKIGRAYRMGRLEIEPHTLNPYGLADLAESIQEEANEVANTRIDNVKHAMSGRYFVRRGSQTDIRTLMRGIPGSVTYTQNPGADIKEYRPPDVTRSSYEEQDRLNLDMDDLLGSFSQSTVQSNRAMNETVGGMNMLRESAEELPEMQVRNFTETWYEPVLRDMMSLEAHYETDKNILSLVGEKYAQNLGDTFRAIGRPAKLTVNVGFGNLNPLMRIERLRVGLSTIESFIPGTLASADVKEIAGEVFGALGFKDGARFLPSLAEDKEVDPLVEQLQRQVQEMQQQLQTQMFKEETKIKVAEINAQNRKEIEAMKQQSTQFVEQLRAQIKQIDQQLAQEQNEIKKRELWMQREALSHTIQEAERRMTMEEARFEQEMTQPLPEEGGEDQLVESLRTPSSGTPIDPRDSTAEISDNQAGVISRGEYGAIPGKEG